MISQRLRILHISDLHIRIDDNGPDGWRLRRVLGPAWEKNIDEIIQDGPVDLICFTGDLAYSGRAEEYEMVTRFIRALLQRTRLPPQRLFIVPGNHDIDRRAA